MKTSSQPLKHGHIWLLYTLKQHNIMKHFHTLKSGSIATWSCWRERRNVWRGDSAWRSYDRVRITLPRGGSPAVSAQPSPLPWSLHCCTHGTWVSHWTAAASGILHSSASQPSRARGRSPGPAVHPVTPARSPAGASPVVY